MSDGITEAASENTQKRLRGRPTLDFYSSAARDFSIGSEAKTDRGKMEGLYASTAARVIFDHRHEHPELTEWTGLYRCEDGKEIIAWGSIKVTVLAELGRLICNYKNGEEVAVKWSVQILNMKPKPSVKRAMKMIRAWRLGKYSDGSTDGLATKITASIDSYLDSHPNTTEEQIEEALNLAMSWYIED
jgi:hypothetical protein